MSDTDLDQLREELMVQQIMLDSLADAGDDHAAKDEEEEIRKDIARLKRLIAKGERGESAIEDDDSVGAGSTGAPGPQSSHLNAQPPRSTPITPRHRSHGHTNYAYSGSPAPFDAYGSNQAVTPQGRAIQTQLPTTSLSVRKRDRSDTGAAGNVEQSKSRRTTPPSGSFGFGSSASRSNGQGDFDFIDLTGDDEYNATSIANSIRDSSRRIGERNRMQESPSRVPRDPAALQGQVNGFERLMNTSRMNAGPASFGAQPQGPAPSFRHNGVHDADDIMSLIPGAYNSSWDEQPAHSVPAGPNAPYMGYAQPTFGQAGMPQSRFPSSGSLQPSSGAGIFSPNSQYSQPHYGALPAAPSSFAGPYRMPSTPGAAPGLPLSNLASVGQQFLRDPSSTLNSIIGRTSSIDFVNGVDGEGNPLQGRMHDIWSQMQDPQVTEKELEDLLKNIRPDMDIEEENRERTPAGLKVGLYYHQELALSWLKKMEEGTNKGGILADDMGLGKTISLISLMTIRQATCRPKTNLIIAPVALMRQWEEEIRTRLKSSHALSTFIYHGKKATTEELLQYDVVLTTYGTLAAEHKRLHNIMEQDRTVDLNDKMYAQKIPLLHPHKAKFHRIILDEAQCIKNDKSLTAKAAHQLRGVHRWCLTGTPMMNGVHELYSLVKFLQIRPYREKENFNRTFRALLKRNEGGAERAMERLRVLLKAILLRRMKNTKINNRPIIDLPPKTEELVHVELSTDEKEYYTTLEKKSQVIFNKYLRDNTVGKNYSNVLVLLLRLRQACCHPHLNHEADDSDNAAIDNEKSVRELGASVIQRIKGMESFECPVCYDAVPNPSFFVPCGHDGCQECLVKIVDSALRSGAGESGSGAFCRCPECRTNFDPKNCFTYETFKKIHMPELAKDEGSGPKTEDTEETEYETDSDQEAQNDDEVDEKGNLKGFIAADDDFFDSDEDDKSRVKLGEPREKKKKKLRKKKKTSSKGKNAVEADDERHAAGVKGSELKTLRKEGHKNQAAYKKYMAYLRRNWLPSAKVTECMKLLKEVQKTGEKTIIFSQWTLLLDLLQVAMYHEDFDDDSFRRYDGTMSADSRVDAARAFQKEDSRVKTILVSLRAGNAGLNLTSASRVIILDPFWNPYIEMQAVDRAYRIGQKREVRVYRILTQETIEDRIMELQEKKKGVVEAALDETESKKIARLSTSELKYLFNGNR